ncbi:MAG: dTDP-4-dehydrorhamnose 3,5-epimerase [Sphingobacteriales bacterium]|jgi:dTDP-4-dehydrorhamnose 3,5-epimerase|nr:dTDP-4-dehydrorhamnose 3,5-epimerase [Sphingobacteriales bacterium]
MPFVKTEFEGLMIFEPSVFNDSRGYFYEAYNKSVFDAEGINFEFVQDNQSNSGYGVIRGLHFQKPPYSQTKLVRVLWGKILDVVVDLRQSSATFGKVFSFELSSENKSQLLIPKGFAHGFSVLSETATILYKCDAFYNKECERGIIFNDLDLAIDWKIPAEAAIISEKDMVLPLFKDCKDYFQ